MKQAICFDECGSELVIECYDADTSTTIAEKYPEIRFRYWESADPDRYYQSDPDYYEGDQL